MVELDFCSFNVRGIHNKLPFIKDFVNNYRLDLFVALETRVKEGNAARISSQINRHFSWLFNYQHHYNGRIWVGWNPTIWAVQLLSSSAQHICFLVTRIVDQVSFVMTTVYAFNEYAARRSLWDELAGIQEQWVTELERPWCILGDFNSFINMNETTGPPPRAYQGISEFRDCVNNIGVTDLRFSGDFFTWRDNNLEDILLRKLDRVLVNDNWLASFDLSQAIFLPRGLSDHSPAAVSLGLRRERIFKPFQIFQHLIEHPGFLQVVKDAWSIEVQGDPWFVLTSKLQGVKKGLKRLNSSTGDLQDNVNRARTELSLFQSNMPSNPDRDCLSHELLLMAQFNKALATQETFLKQKSRIKWLNCGDNNNKFFFNCCKARWNNRKILALQSNGHMVHSHREISTEAVNYFTNLLGCDRPVLPILNDLCFNRLSEDQCSTLSRDFLNADIKSTFMHLAKLKSPGPDGWTAEFFIAAWEVIGDDIIKAVNYFFHELHLPNIVNSAALALIPKIPNASSMNLFRPISCCNVLYKAITKMLTHRMKNIMSDLISPNQVAFVKGRKIGDHVLLAQALCKDYHLNFGPPRIAFKLDLTKAFDTINWQFLFDALELYGFPSKFINWIKACITGSMLSIKVNGSLEGYFKCKSGLKQGDPLSPYLFVLAMEVLTACINLKTRSGDFKYHCKAKEAGITNLIFADDVMLFCKGDNNSVQIMLEAVDLFSRMTGLSPNKSKCVVFFGNVPSLTQDFAIATSGFNRGYLPVTYLGLPLISGKLNERECQPLISRICGKFEAWGNTHISQAGRAQLLKSIIFGIQGFWSQYLFLPKKILKRIQSLMSKFLWKGVLDGRCIYKVSWSHCCFPKTEGGLGFKELLGWNQSAICHQLWRIIRKKDDSLWLKWVHKSLLKRKGIWTMSMPGKCSWAVRKILNARSLVLRHISYKVGVDSDFLLWHDPWGGPHTMLQVLGTRAISSLESFSMAPLRSIIRDGHWFLGPSNDMTVINLRLRCASVAIHDEESGTTFAIMVQCLCGIILFGANSVSQKLRLQLG
ncbi:uncharacterized protein LOC108203686 [Daucus carota subsp. sativus]|uniref:uncharacterized protein LOC108203686 n=1 Tax=Daucus carota subsp. sativus TaxID=79200 RepID=UPI0007EF1D22|nr:PREDICTED: uncharacterized protein LOC108203686 [Daucus carota subsp. sativus]